LNALSIALEQEGCKVIWFTSSDYTNYSEVVNFLSSGSIDFCVLTNGAGMLSSCSTDAKQFLFEFFSGQIIFIHHDNLFTMYNDIRLIEAKVRAFLRVNNRSAHFCIEAHNVKDLKLLGIRKTYSFLHASEFLSHPEPPDSYKSDVSFVGHVLPNKYQPVGDKEIRGLLQSCFNERIEKMDSKIEAKAIAFANFRAEIASEPFKHFLYKYWFISAIHMSSQFFRGEIISRMADFNIDIIGGDPAYLHGVKEKSLLKKEGVKYFPPMNNYTDAASVYRNSRINLNITSLQFDQAVINRIIDVGASGGFILTDSKVDLRKLTTVADEISYRSVDELNNKIEYFLSNNKERLNVAEQLNIDISRKCTYQKAVQNILSKI
jgi:spore maturation protein CgeB